VYLETLFKMRFAIYSLLAFGLSCSASAASLHEEIDSYVEAGFSRFEVAPAQRCDDDEFVRRIYLDFTGKIPDARTASRFIANTNPEKRASLIQQLLDSNAFAERMAVVFDVMLMERRADKYVTTPEWRAYLAKSFAENKPLDVLAREILVGGSVEDELRPAGKFYLDRAVDKDALVRDTGRLFLGMDLQCAQCHDHPTIDDWKHQHYFGLSVFFAGSKIYKRPDGKIALQENLIPDVEFVSVFKPDITNKTGPQVPFGKTLTIPPFEKGEEFVEKPSKTVPAVLKFGLRDLLANELPTSQTPAFSRNLANRLWGIMLGRGIVHPYDMDHSENPPSHPELLDFLSLQLQELKFDTKTFLKEIALSETYQRSSAAPVGVDPNSIPPESFAMAILKGLSPEQLFESLLASTQSDDVFASQIEASLREDGEKYEELSADGEKMEVARTDQRTKRIAEFVGTFASTPGRPEGEFQASLPQALFLANYNAVVEWLEPRDGNLAEQLLGRDEPRSVAEDAYLAILSRYPTEEEIALATEHFEARGQKRPAAVTELIWSLIASAEFRLNH
jgi:hypothetical protein